MKSTRAKQLLDEIDLAISNITGFNNLSQLEESYLAKFLVVFICGIYEEIIETIIIEKVSQCNLQEARTFIVNNVKRYFQNPRIKTIINLLNQFNLRWGQRVDTLPYESKFALDSIITNKNHLAHMGACSITLREIITYYKDSRIVVETIDNVVL